MRELLLLNQDWNLLVNPPEPQVVKSKAGMYIAAKTERLKWGPGAFHHNDNYEFWSFQQELNPEQWQKVDLPNDYIIGQKPVRSESGPLGYFTYVPAWYRKHVKLQPEDQDKRITVFFEGITGKADIYLNGCFLKHNEGSYVSFEVDITDLARFDQENVLAVHVDPNTYEGWWYAGGGIYRNVWLLKTDKVAVERWGAFLPVKELNGDTWEVPLHLELRNDDYQPHAVSVSCQIMDPDQQLVATLRTQGNAAPRDITTLHAKTTLQSPQRWDLDNPNLYQAIITVEKDGHACDTYTQTFGFRTVTLSPQQGLFLNGKNIKLKGVCGHLDCGLTGKAVTDNLCQYKMKLIKEMGANAFRTSHYPHQNAVMDACDRMGLLVLDETRRFESNPEAIQQLEMMVRRDRNRPSVFIWSTGNEETQYYGLPQGHNIHRAMEAAIRKLDPTRPVTTCIAAPAQNTIQQVAEVIGVNYSLKHLDKVHQDFPQKPFICTENCAVASTRGTYFGDSTSTGRLDARDRNSPTDPWYFGREKTWKFIMDRPWIAGTFQWDAFEHRGEAIWPRLCSVSGAIDLFLQKKDAFYQNQSHWLDKPMIHMLPHWNHHGLEGTTINLWIYTNCQEVELTLNGTSLGRKNAEPWTHLEWNLAYEPGTIKAIGYVNGKVAATDINQTADQPAALKLTLDTPNLKLNGQDTAIITCTALDRLGRPVPDATPTVDFDCTGDGTIVGTGSDITDHVPVPALTRKMFAGQIGVAVRVHHPSAQSQHAFTLYARANGLDTARLDVSLSD